ncbi:Uncharacterised protein, partial [Mycoplasma putrefaciens]
MNDRFSKVPNALKGILVNKVKSNNLLKNIIKTLNSDDFVFKDLVLRTIIIENAAIKKSIFQQNTKQDKIKLDFAINNKKLNNW